MIETADKTYQGWTNQETWCVNLWLNDDKFVRNVWRERAQECRDLSREQGRGHELLNNEEFERFTLADLLKEEIEYEAEQEWPLTLLGALLTVALGKVDWQEIAACFLSTL